MIVSLVFSSAWYLCIHCLLASHIFAVKHEAASRVTESSVKAFCTHYFQHHVADCMPCV